MNKKIILLLFLTVTLVGVWFLPNIVKADARPFCVCEYKQEKDGSCADEGLVEAYLTEEKYFETCENTNVSVFQNLLINKTICWVSCTPQMCTFIKDSVFTKEIEIQNDTNEYYKDTACVSPEAEKTLDECAKAIAGLDCSDKLPSPIGTNVSVCDKACNVGGKCEWDPGTQKCNIKDPSQIPCGKIMKENECNALNQCVWSGKCVEKGSVATPATSVAPPTTPKQLQSYYSGYYEVPKGYVGALPPCAFSGTCRNVNDLLELIINFGSGMFVIIGSFAFAFFVYGGFTILSSFGNAERVKKGRDIMVASVIGLVIALSAYLLIDFMLDALNVDPNFREIGK